jgi:hypothetical protein
MLRSVVTLLGIAATLMSFNLPANESARGIALAELRSSARPVANRSGATLPGATLAMPARGADSQLSFDSPESAEQEPANAWLYALGFLGLVVLRRTRSGPMS